MTADPKASGDLAASLARTRKSYDETPYVSVPLQHAHPGRLAAAALWHGLAAPDVATARVLEVGCASGGHILPLAAALPGARFLGVDLSPVQIAAGEARRQRLALANVELRAGSFEAIDEADGAFDYIVCHGVYSWIPESLREALLRMIRDRLSPNGVAMVSFNVLPGWRLFQIARDAMLMHARLVEDPALRLAGVGELFERLARESRNTNSYGKFWRDEARRMARGGEAYWAHEIFEDSNAPETFVGFCDRLSAFGLSYLSECVLSANCEDTIAADGAESIRALARGDRMARETYIDIFSGRSFREAALVSAARVGDFRDEPTAEALSQLHFLPDLKLELHTDPVEPEVFHLTDGDSDLGFRGAAVAEAMRGFVARRPGSARIADLASSVGSELRAAILETLKAAVELGLAAVSTTPVRCSTRLAERSKIWPVAASDAAEGDATANLRHAPVRLDPFQRFLAPMLDGTRRRSDLIESALDQVRRGALTVNGPDGPIVDAAHLRAKLGDATDRALAGLLRNALLVES